MPSLLLRRTRRDAAHEGSGAQGPHRSLWLQEALGDAPTEPSLSGTARADVAIIGGGFVGLWTAIRIKEREPACDVVLLEQDVCGGGASGRNGGVGPSRGAEPASPGKICGAPEAGGLGRVSRGGSPENAHL